MRVRSRVCVCVRVRFREFVPFVRVIDDDDEKVPFFRQCDLCAPIQGARPSKKMMQYCFARMGREKTRFNDDLIAENRSNQSFWGARFPLNFIS